MSSTTSPTPRIPFVAVQMIVAVIAAAIFMSIAYLVSTRLFFGTPLGFVALFAAAFAAAVAFFLMGLSEKNATNAALITILLCSWAAILSPSVQASQIAMRANSKLQMAAELLGHAPAIAPQVKAMTANISTTQENREFLIQVANATVSRQQITSHLDNAGAFGADAGFVVANAMIRPKDRDDLFRKAMNQAAAGNRDAIAFLQTSNHDTQ